MYPTRKKRILDNFPLETSHLKGYGDFDDDEVEVVCVISKHPSRAPPRADPLSHSHYFDRPQSHPITLLPRDDFKHLHKSSWTGPPSPPPRDDPPYRMDYLAQPLEPYPTKEVKMLQRLSDNTWIEVDVPVDPFDQSKRVLGREHNQMLSWPPPYDSPNARFSQSNHYYEEPMPFQIYESTTPSSFDLPVSKPTRVANETVRYSLSPREKTLERMTPLTEPEPEPQCKFSDERQPMCSICMAPAESFYLNFGATSCSSCRAFFRRCVLKNLYQGLVCHYGRRCVLTMDNRSDCRKCRFDKCVQQGMKCSAVLNHTQKTTRFRKHIARKQLQKLNEKMELKRTLRTFRITRPTKSASESAEQFDY